MRKSLISACSLIALGAMTSQPSHGQSMDYASLETLFGEPVTTSATGTPQKAGDVAANMTIITADEIRQSGSRSIPEILSRIPGLDISQTSSVAFDVGVRGYQQQMQSRLLVLIDGRQVFQDDYSRTVWENLPVNIDDIRQIEVVKGPSSALFGSNAAGGVVNIVTTNPLYDGNNVVNLTGGTSQTRSGDATLSTKIGEIGAIKLSAGGMDAREFNTARENFGGVVGGEITAAQATAQHLTGRASNDEYLLTMNPYHRYVSSTQVFQLGPDVQTDSEFSLSKSRSTEGYYNGHLDGVEDMVASARGGFTWQSPVGTVKNSNYWNLTRVTNFESGTAAPYYVDSTSLIVSQLEDQFRIGTDHTFRVSGEYRYETFHLEANQTFPQDPKIAENKYAAGAMWLWQIRDDLSWTNAGRVDHVDLSEIGQLWAGDLVKAGQYNHGVTAESANSGLVYKPTGDDTFRLAFGRAVAMPRLLDYGFNVDIYVPSVSRGFDRTGNPDLKPTIVTNYELDYDRKLAVIDSTVKTAVFYQINQDLITPIVTVGSASTALTPKPTQVTTLTQSVNVGGSRGVGGEFELKGQNRLGIRWDASYSYAVTSDDPGVALALGDRFHDSTPKHHARLLLGYTKDSWEFDVHGEYQTDYLSHRGTNINLPVDDYSSLTARLAYNIDQTYTLALSGTNLSQAVTYTSAYPAIKRQTFLSLTGKF